MKKLSTVFFVFAALLSHVMCAAVAYDYSYLKHFPATSFPTWVAFLTIIPYALAIAICLVTGILLKRRGK